MVRFLAILPLLLCTPLAVQARSPSPYTCQIYFSDTADLPQDVQSLLKIGVDAVEMCVSQRTGQVGGHAIVSKVFANPQGPCAYSKRAVFKAEEAGLASKWAYTPPEGRDFLARTQMLMALQRIGCPRQDARGYIPVENVSAGVFVELMGLWERILAARELTSFLLAGAEELKAAEHFQRLDSALKRAAQGGGAKLVVAAISLQTFDQIQNVHYQLLITSGDTNWHLDVDLVSGQWRILGVGGS